MHRYIYWLRWLCVISLLVDDCYCTKSNPVILAGRVQFAKNIACSFLVVGCVIVCVSLPRTNSIIIVNRYDCYYFLGIYQTSSGDPDFQR